MPGGCKMCCQVPCCSCNVRAGWPLSNSNPGILEQFQNFMFYGIAQQSPYSAIYNLQCAIIPTSNTNRKVVSRGFFKHMFGTCFCDAPWEPPIKAHQILVSKDASFAAVGGLSLSLRWDVTKTSKNPRFSKHSQTLASTGKTDETIRQLTNKN